MLTVSQRMSDYHHSLTCSSAHIAAKSSVALTATSAASYLIVCVPVFELIGVRAGGLGGE